MGLNAGLSMGRAAKVARVSKSTLSRAIKSGRLSATRNDDGGWLIDPAELARVYECNPATGSDNGCVAHRATSDAPPPQPLPETDAAVALREQVAGLQAQLELMRDQLGDAREARDDARSERDEWRDQARASQRLLENARAPSRTWFGLRRA